MCQQKIWLSNATDMPYAKITLCASMGRYANMYMPHMNSLALTMLPGAGTQMTTMTPMMMQDDDVARQSDYIYSVGHLAKSVKKDT